MTEETFAKQLAAIGAAAQSAWAHYTLYWQLIRAFNSEPSIPNSALAFWTLTIDAHQKTFLFELARLFDKQRGSLHLGQWLRAMRGSLDLFSDTARKSRLQLRLEDEGAVENLMKDYAVPTEAEVDQDLALCDPRAAPVSTLLIYRNKSFAHVNLLHVNAGTHVSAEVQLTNEQVDTLFHYAEMPINKYSHAFDASRFAMKIYGGDDYHRVLDAVRMSIQHRITAGPLGASVPRP